MRQVKRPDDAPRLPVVRGNAGIQAWYRRKLEQAVTEMHQSFVYWLAAEYRATGLARDDSPSARMRAETSRLGRRWQKVFDKLADSMSKRLADRVLAHSDSALRNGLQGQGLTVKFTMTPAMNDAYRAVIGEQVGLIKSIASQHLTEVEGLVMRSVARGRDLGTLTKELQARYGVTKRRAALIARTTNNQATATLQAARQRDIGITHGIWKHSHAGKVPRPSHVKANGERFDLSKGLYLDGEWIMPGQLINCKCGWVPEIPGFDS